MDFYKLFTDFGFDMFKVADGRLEPVAAYSYAYENFTADFSFAARRRSAAALKPPAGFSEAGYLRNNPDVEVAVRNQSFASGFHHWFIHGEAEGRGWA